MKKASLLLIAVIIALSISFAGCGNPRVSGTTTELTKTESQSLTAQTSEETATETETTAEPVIPEVITYYERDKTFKVDEDFTAGFIVKLPKIVSSKPGALKINSEIDKIRINIEEEYNSVSDITDYKVQNNCSYQTFVKEKVIFLTVLCATGWWASEYDISNSYYAYNYEDDKQLSDNEIAEMFSLNESQVLDKINTVLDERGVSKIYSLDNVNLFVKSNSILSADVFIGGEYSEIVELT